MAVRQATEVMLVRQGIQAQEEQAEEVAVLDFRLLQTERRKRIQMLFLVQPDLRVVVQEGVVGQGVFRLMEGVLNMALAVAVLEIPILALLAYRRHDQHLLILRLNLLAEHRVVEPEGKVIARVELSRLLFTLL